jgi:hypothetical protein
MFEVSLTFDAPPDPTSISGEQTQARLDEFRQIWLEPDWEDTTRTALQVIERYWHRYVLYFRRLGLRFYGPTFANQRRYCSHINVNYKEALLREEPAMYMNFFDWMDKTSRKKKKDTYDVYWRRVCLYFSLFAKREMNDHVLKQMRRVWTAFPDVVTLSLTKPSVHQYSSAGGLQRQCAAQTETHRE